MSFDYIFVAASNSTEEFKSRADFVCVGKNDEQTIPTIKFGWMP